MNCGIFFASFGPWRWHCFGLPCVWYGAVSLRCFMKPWAKKNLRNFCCIYRSISVFSYGSCWPLLLLCWFGKNVKSSQWFCWPYCWGSLRWPPWWWLSWAPLIICILFCLSFSCHSPLACASWLLQRCCFIRLSKTARQVSFWNGLWSLWWLELPYLKVTA